jgi:P27 family predicted phage terminase small subunit
VVSREIFPSFHDLAMYNRPFSEKDVDPMRGPEPQKLMKMEPAYAIRLVTNPPADFDSVAEAEWLKVGEILAFRNLLGGDTEATLEAYCRCVSDMRKYAQVLKAEGDFRTLPNGRLGRHPAHDAYCTALTLLRQYAGELGLTPARRAVGNKIKNEFKANLTECWEGLLA